MNQAYKDPSAKEGLSVLKSMQRTRGLHLPLLLPSPTLTYQARLRLTSENLVGVRRTEVQSKDPRNASTV